MTRNAAAADARNRALLSATLTTPIRARLVKDLNELGRYPYCGHSVVMGKAKKLWQDTEGVHGMFGENLMAARRAYRAFVEKGIAEGRRHRE